MPSFEDGLPKLKRGGSPDFEAKKGSEVLCGRKERDVERDERRGSAIEGVSELTLPLATLLALSVSRAVQRAKMACNGIWEDGYLLLGLGYSRGPLGTLV